MDFIWLLVGINILALSLFTYLQFFTLIFEKHHWMGEIFLLLIGIAAAILFFWSTQQNLATPWVWIIGLLAGLVAIIFTLFFIIKFFFLPETRFRKSHSLLRNRTDFSLPYKKFYVTTEDNVSIAGIHINQGKKKLIIVCHGGGRSKNILGNIMLCEWLAYTYDVITFDFRGHYESSGFLSGDGSTSLDVQAVVEYAKGLGYEKIGMVGRSLGAWSAILEVAQFHNVDSLVASAAPMGGIQDAPITKKLPPWAMSSIGKILARIIVGIRFSTFEGQNSLASVIGGVSPTPLLLVYCEDDPVIKMTKLDAEFIFSKAQEPKKLIIFEGHGHILEAKYIQRYFEVIQNWFRETLN